MAAKHTLHVALTEPLVQHVRDQVAAGRYVNASEAVRRALLLLIEQEEPRVDRTSSGHKGTLAHPHG